MVHVYGKPGCVQCKFTIKMLDAAGVPREYHDINQEPDAMKIVEQTGRRELPFVTAGEDSWHGLRPDKIKALTLVSA